MIRLFVFDMAGTTVDEDNLVYKTIQAALRRAGQDFPLDEVLRIAAGKAKMTAIRDLLSSKGVEPDEAVARVAFEDFNANLLKTYQTSPIRPQQGAEEVFRALQQKGIKVALNTGYSSATAALILERLGWSDHPDIDAVVTADEVPQGRPAPDMIYLAMKRTGVEDPKVVGKAGDAVVDIEEGRNAGCSLLVGITTGAHRADQLASAKPTHILDRLTDLLPLL